MSKRKTTEEFIQEARQVHGSKFDYSKVIYRDRKTKVCIICPTHGEFWQTPACHLRYGCKECSCNTVHDKQRFTTETFISKAKAIHGNKYDYSETHYVNGRTKVKIICPLHGEFWQNAHSHLRGSGCPKCAALKNSERFRSTTTEFIEKAKRLYKNLYSYNKVIYLGNKRPVIITCPKHGDFEQLPNTHLSGHGCPKCAKRNSQLNFYNRLLSDLNISLIFDKRLNWLGIQSLDIYSEQYNFAIEYNGIQHYEPIEFFGGQKAFIYRNFLDAKKEFLCAKNKCKLFIVKYDYTEDDYQKLLTEIRELIYERNSNSQVSLGETQNNSRIYFWRGRIRYDDGCLAGIRSGKRRVSRPMFASLFNSR